jgi:PD-(D/E)XK nuclease superfamily
MAQYYKPKRNSNWNYGGPNWRLSRSKIDLFISCKRCFYLDNKIGTARPKGFPFNLNSAVDTLLKKEFDIHRAEGNPHPLMKAYGLDAVPFAHAKIDEWRDALRAGIQYKHPETGMTISGGIDDVWVRPNGELIIADYKATSKEEEVNLDADWQDGYKRQMEVYQWLFRKNGFPVSDTGYFVYANGMTDREAFDAKLEFDIKLIPYTGDDSWVEGVISSIKVCLDDPRIPKASDSCDYCLYVDTVKDVMAGKKNSEERIENKEEKKARAPKKTAHEDNPNTLF